uniref:Uncharacterized protein n=1 Tax=Magallana gigas TaxID=29159 RepID=K1PHA4_MAGGI
MRIRETVVYDSVQDPRVPDLSGDQLQVSASDHCLRARDQDQNDVISIFGFQKSNHVFITETVTDSPSPTPLPTDDDDHTGTIVGVVIPVFFILMILVGIYIYRRRGKVSYEQVY